mmetsp:Transcript_63421/g.151251  ORF Transcript_63421/g.151251 Transcript_63421/m.151251 type:complete len:214 (+) Transcript_63421:234-875(+)
MRQSRTVDLQFGTGQVKPIQRARRRQRRRRGRSQWKWSDPRNLWSQSVGWRCGGRCVTSQRTGGTCTCRSRSQGGSSRGWCGRCQRRQWCSTTRKAQRSAPSPRSLWWGRGSQAWPRPTNSTPSVARWWFWTRGTGSGGGAGLTTRSADASSTSAPGGSTGARVTPSRSWRAARALGCTSPPSRVRCTTRGGSGSRTRRTRRSSAATTPSSIR